MKHPQLWGLPLQDVAIPLIAWAIIASYYLFQMYRRITDNRGALANMKDHNSYHHNYFYHMRSGWVHKNHLTGQGTANSTRDYLRVLIFLVGNTSMVAALVLGYATTLFDEPAPEDRMLLIKLVMCGIIFSIMFFMFLFSMRYAVQFHFLMNVDMDSNGVMMNKNVIITVFNRSHLYYGAGLRLYYSVIPLFSWAISSWLLMVVCPVYVLLMRDYDNDKYLEDSLEVMYKDTKFGRYKAVANDGDHDHVGEGEGEGDGDGDETEESAGAGAVRMLAK